MKVRVDLPEVMFRETDPISIALMRRALRDLLAKEQMPILEECVDNGGRAVCPDYITLSLDLQDLTFVECVGDKSAIGTTIKKYIERLKGHPFKKLIVYAYEPYKNKTEHFVRDGWFIKVFITNRVIRRPYIVVDYEIVRKIVEIWLSKKDKIQARSGLSTNKLFDTFYTIYKLIEQDDMFKEFVIWSR